MDADAWGHLAVNLGLGAFLIILWVQLLEVDRISSTRLQAVLFGCVMGGAAVASMALPVELGPGLLLDLRGVFLALAGLFGGLGAAAIAAAVGLAYRIHIAGTGMVAGCVGILIYALAGAAGHRLSRARPGYGHLVAVAIGAPLLAMISRQLFLLQIDGLRFPVPYIFPGLVGFGILGLGLGLLQAQRRHELFTRHALYRAMVEALPDCLNVKDLQGRFLVANPATARLMGAASAADLIGRSDVDFYPAATADRYQADEAAFLAEGRSVVIDQEIPNLDGTPKWVTSLKAPFIGPDGKVAGIITHNRDVTEAKRLQLELGRTKANLDEALATMADGLALYDRELRLVFCNRQYQAMFPRSSELRVPGAYFPDIAREAARRGEFGDLQECEIEAFVEASVAHLRSTGTRELKDAEGRWLQTRTRSTGDGGILIVVTDITDRKRIEHAIEHRATHDALTGLPNRALFHAELDGRRQQATTEGTQLAVMLVDLDRFKEINDTHGHAVGDALLVEVARRLTSAVREGDLVARLGGDEFAILATAKESRGAFAGLAQRIVERMTEPLVLQGLDLQPSCTVGLTVYPTDPGSAEQLLVDADRALYVAKEAGRGSWKLFEPAMTEAVGRSQALASGLFRAVAQNELDVDYQPIIDVATLEVVAVEALVRWNHPERGRLGAQEFIHAVESGPAILPITRFVLHKALQDRDTWRDAGAGDLRVWVNLAPRCLGWDGFLDSVVATLAQFDGAAEHLVLEVTEAMLIGVDDADLRLADLRRLGLEIAIDDFGSGYSSLRRLATLPVDVLKIDRLFVTEMVRNPRAAAVIDTIVSLGRILGLTLTAEGIETAEQLARLAESGCQLAQGYLIARPMPGERMSGWLREWRQHRGQSPNTDLLLRASRQG